MSSNSFSQVQIIAHRGASAHAPENTICAIQKAIELNSPYIEIDVHQTADGQVVAIHDSSVERTTNGKGEVSELTFNQLRELDAGSWFDKKFSSEKIPTLMEVIEIIPKHTKLIIELKDGSKKYPHIEENIINLINQKNFSKQVILKSFNTNILKKFKQIAPQVERLYCVMWSWRSLTIDTFIRFKSLFELSDATYYQIHQNLISQGIIDEIHKRNKKVVAWGVNETSDFKKMISMQVDFIETDYPARIHKL